MIGREKERAQLIRLYESGEAQFVAVYGRRRVGKTYLVNSVFENRFTFRHAGLSPVEGKEQNSLKKQLEQFHATLRLHGLKDGRKPKTWIEAFYLLETLLINKDDGSRQLVFIDELPWLDTPRSGFITALEGFWNSWACGRKNFMLVVSGSSNSWIQNNLINNHGGLYGRVTCEIKLEPFTLRECEEYFRSNDIIFSRYDIVQSYMAFGGIPYYLGYFSPSLSLAQNIDEILFTPNAKLRTEFDRLFKSVFKNARNAELVVRLLGSKGIGYTRKEIADKTGIPEGESLTEVLRVLTACDFIISYTPFGESRKLTYYKLVDPFCLFHLRFVEGMDSLNRGNTWLERVSSHALSSWRGLAFENVCFNHIAQIKQVLGISNLATRQSVWTKKADGTDGFQVDLVIERNDNIVNICEMKFYSGDYTVTKDYYKALLERTNLVSTHLNRKQSIRNTLVTTFALKKNEYSTVFSDVITLDDLFK